jgi:hypothetical protein
MTAESATAKDRAKERAETLDQFRMIRRYRTIQARAIATDIDCHRKPARLIAAQLRQLADWIEQTADRDPTEDFVPRR